MKTFNFDIDINAPREVVWSALWEDESYRDWTSAFCEGSHAVSQWEEGSSILFLDPNKNGMYSLIEKLVPNKFMSFKHIGEVKDGKEMPMNDDTEKWTGSHENYTLVEVHGSVTLKVEVDVIDSFADVFTKIFPQALNKLKEIAESKVNA